jgi:hypothetical protein
MEDGIRVQDPVRVSLQDLSDDTEAIAVRIFKAG